jgi:hypothetical protein
MTTADTRSRLGSGSSDASDPVQAATDAVRAALAGRSPSAADLVVLFSTIQYDPDQLLAGATRAAGPAQVVGCTAFGAFTADEQVPGGVVAAYLPAGDLTFGVAGVDSIGTDIYAAAKRCTQLAQDRAGGEGEHSVLMMFTDGLAGDQREVVRGSYAVTGATVPLVGGAAAENQSMVKTYQFAENNVMSNGLVAVWINAPHPLGVGVEHGWYPIGEPMIVTRAAGNIVYELDGQPAADAYLSHRGSGPLARNLSGGDALFAASVVDHPLGLANASGRFDARHVLDRTDDGCLVLFGHVSEQSVVQVMAGEWGDLVQAAHRATADAVSQLDTEPRGGLVFSCTARVAPLAGHLAAEASAVAAAMPGAPVAGFFTYGEFARVTGSTGFHNATVAVLAF